MEKLPKGVYKKRGAYQSYRTINGVSQYLGSFKTPEEAKKAYDDFVKKHGLKQNGSNRQDQVKVIAQCVGCGNLTKAFRSRDIDGEKFSDRRCFTCDRRWVYKKEELIREILPPEKKMKKKVERKIAEISGARLILGRCQSAKQEER